MPAIEEIAGDVVSRARLNDPLEFPRLPRAPNPAENRVPIFKDNRHRNVYYWYDDRR